MISTTPPPVRPTILPRAIAVPPIEARDRYEARAACDLCAEHGITTIAVDDVRTPGGMWANVCEAHRYRIEGEALAVRGGAR